ncbi:MAG: hypothetical protein ACD_67C00044G0001 [uncultured bacterium]|nr:MAG: hypothetical protein ACD_67C00044G0001 [uncultured bacterium]
MKRALIFIVGCFFTATLSGCIYVDSGYAPNGYYANNNMVIAAARYNTMSNLLYSQRFYTPTVAVAVPCGPTPFEVALGKGALRQSHNSGHSHHNNNGNHNNRNRGDDGNRNRRGR